MDNETQLTPKFTFWMAQHKGLEIVTTNFDKSKAAPATYSMFQGPAYFNSNFIYHIFYIATTRDTLMAQGFTSESKIGKVNEGVIIAK